MPISEQDGWKILKGSSEYVTIAYKLCELGFVKIHKEISGDVSKITIHKETLEYILKNLE